MYFNKFIFCNLSELFYSVKDIKIVSKDATKCTKGFFNKFSPEIGNLKLDKNLKWNKRKEGLKLVICFDLKIVRT